jgi:hypothetical protein
MPISKDRKYLTHNIAQNLNTGELLLRYYTAHRTRIAAMSRLLGRNIKGVMQFSKNSSIQTAILWEISMVLKHNFFMDIASKLPPEFSTYAPISDVQTKRIADLEQQLALVTAERDVLIKVINKVG